MVSLARVMARIWDEPGPIIESCGSITSHKNHTQKVNCWFFLVISSSQHPHPLVRPGHKKRDMPGHLARQEGECWNETLSVCVCLLSVLKMLVVPHIYWATAQGTVTLSLYIISDSRDARCTLASDWPVCLTKPSDWLSGPGCPCLVWAWPEWIIATLYFILGMGTSHLGNVVREVSEWLQPGYNSDGQHLSFILWSILNDLQ